MLKVKNRDSKHYALNQKMQFSMEIFSGSFEKIGHLFLSIFTFSFGESSKS